MRALLDTAALAMYPIFAGLCGYTFRAGRGEALAADAKAVHRLVWGEKGALPPADASAYGRRYDDATTWIVCYQGAAPVGAIGIVDLRVASVALDYCDRRLPDTLDTTATREIGRLAVHPAHRGGARTVMIGLAFAAQRWCLRHGVTTMLAASTERLFEVYARLNPSAALIQPPVNAPDAQRDRFFGPLRACCGKGVVFTFCVAEGSPWSVLSRLIMRRMKRSAPQLATA